MFGSLLGRVGLGGKRTGIRRPVTITVESRKRDRMEADYVSANGLRHGTKGLDLYFEIVIGNGTTMRWLPDTYPHVLRAAKKAAKQLSGAEARTRVAKAAR